MAILQGIISLLTRSGRAAGVFVEAQAARLSELAQ